jgi:hypothetical protein
MSQQQYPAAVEDQQPLIAQPLVYGYAQQQQTSEYYQHPAMPRRRERSRCCVLCCSILSCFVCVLFVVGIIVLVMLLRCMNAITGLKDVQMYGPELDAVGINGVDVTLDYGRIEVLCNADNITKNISFIFTTLAATKSVVDGITPVLTVDDDGIVKFTIDSRYNDVWDCPQAQVKILMPCQIDSKMMVANLKIGDIKYSDMPVKFKSVKSNVPSGEIRTENLKTSYAEFIVTNGRFKGSIELLPEECNLKIESSNGAIDVDSITLGAATLTKFCTIEAKSQNGDIEINDISGFAGSYDLSTKNGEVLVDGPISIGTNTHIKKTGSVSSGHMSLTATNSNGEVDVHFV